MCQTILRLAVCFLLAMPWILHAETFSENPTSTRLNTRSGFIINHDRVNLSDISENSLTAAKNNVVIMYGHTSHGSQLITGAEYLRDQIDAVRYNFQAAWERVPSPTTPASLRVGNNGSWGWDAGAFLSNARSLIDMNLSRPETKVFMWSWCGQMSDDGSYTDEVVDQYLDLMQQLELEYPEVRFVYMTGHTDRWNRSTLERRNNMIRDFVRGNGKILYDFADIESYLPDGTPAAEPNDDCPWCADWCEAHPDDCRNLPTTCAHSHGLNCKIKGIALWRLAAEIAGDNGQQPGLDASQWLSSFYVAYWGRAGDPGGLDYWLGEVSRGATDVPGVAENFALSAEAKAMYPYFNAPEAATDAERASFVQAVYQNLLNRSVSGDDEGVVYWVSELRDGNTTPGAVIGHMINAAIQAAGADWLTIWNKVQVAEYFTQKFAASGRTWTDAHLDLARQALQGVTDDPDTVVAGRARVDGLLP